MNALPCELTTSLMSRRRDIRARSSVQAFRIDYGKFVEFEVQIIPSYRTTSPSFRSLESKLPELMHPISSCTLQKLDTVALFGSSPYTCSSKFIPRSKFSCRFWASKCALLNLRFSWTMAVIGEGWAFGEKASPGEEGFLGEGPSCADGVTTRIPLIGVPADAARRFVG